MATKLPIDEKAAALNKALQQSLELNKPEVFELLVKKGAKKNTVNASKLYSLKDVEYQMNILRPFVGRNEIGHKHDFENPKDTHTELTNTDASKHEGDSNLPLVKHLLRDINQYYTKDILRKDKTSFVDLLIWAILVNRIDLAKAIWRQTTAPVHTALLACHLYATLLDWFPAQEIFLTYFKWFEKSAVKVLSEMKYDDAKLVLELEWKFERCSALELAERAQCKEFFAQPYLQRYLDQKLNSDAVGEVLPGTSWYYLLVLVIIPFWIKSSRYYKYHPGNTNTGTSTGSDNTNTINNSSLRNINISNFRSSSGTYDLLTRSSDHDTKGKNKSNSDDSDSSSGDSNSNSNSIEKSSSTETNILFYHFYSLPVVKFLNTTLCYLVFLVILSANVIGCVPGEFEIRYFEWLLWIWLFAFMTEEIIQFYRHPDGYFDLLTNQMDFLMYICLVVYLALRIVAWKFESQTFHEAYTSVLIISTIICYMRLLNVFAYSKSLGPLFFVIVRLFNDVWQWLIIFFVFMLSFQLGFIALTRQAGYDPWIAYPEGTLGVAFTAIIGDLGNAMDWMGSTPIGVVLLCLYSLIAQIMLVNLLIAMMGNTYNSVSENANKEWKFYRYRIITDYINSSPCPPPFNLIGIIFNPKVCFTRAHEDKKKIDSYIVTAMQGAKKRVLDARQEKTTATLAYMSRREQLHMRSITTGRIDDMLNIEHRMNRIEHRMEYRMNNITTSLEQLKEQIFRISVHG
jgi:hypothetical protein